MIRYGSADQADTILEFQQLASLGEDAVDGALAGRPEGVPRQAEAAAAPAAARDLDEAHIAEFGVPGKDGRMGGDSVEVRQPLAPDSWRWSGTAFAIGQVEARDLGQGFEGSIATIGHELEGSGQRLKDGLDLTDEHAV